MRRVEDPDWQGGGEVSDSDDDVRRPGRHWEWGPSLRWRRTRNSR
jgi:hypothetical protein